jgi:hypothetical protein
LTLADPADEPSLSVTFYAAPRPDPAGVARELLDAALAYLDATRIEPLPVPDWMSDLSVTLRVMMAEHGFSRDGEGDDP